MSNNLSTISSFTFLSQANVSGSSMFKREEMPIVFVLHTCIWLPGRMHQSRRGFLLSVSACKSHGALMQCFTPESVLKKCKAQGSQSTLSLVCHATTTAVRLSSLPSSKARLSESTSTRLSRWITEPAAEPKHEPQGRRSCAPHTPRQPAKP